MNLARHRYPPKGYNQLQYPLPHNFTYKFGLSLEAATKNSTMLTLFRATKKAAGVEAIEVNPKNAAFAEDGGTAVQMGSIIPKTSFTIHAQMTKAAIETDKLRQLRFSWFPIYTAFLSPLEAQDDKTTTSIEDILELTHTVGDESTSPLFSNVDLLDAGNQPLSTVGFAEVIADFGLTTNALLESVAFDKELFRDAMQYYGNQGMLKKVVGRMNNVIISRDRMYRYHSNNFTNPAVKRGNPYMFCGVMFHIEQVGGDYQPILAADTTVIDHVYFNVNVRFDEWHPLFDQATF